MLCTRLKFCLNKNSKTAWEIIAEFALNLYLTILKDYAYSGIR